MSSQPPPHGRRSSSTSTIKPVRRKNAYSSDQFQGWLQTPEMRREAAASRSRVAASSSRTPSNSTSQPASPSAPPIARTNTSARPPSGRQNTPPANAFTRRITPPSPPSPACSSLTRSHSPPSTSGSVLTRTPPSPSSVMRTPPGGTGLMHTPPSPVSARKENTLQQRHAQSPRGTHAGKPPVQPRTRPPTANTSKNSNQKTQATKKGTGLFKGPSSKGSGANGAPRKDRDGGSGSGARLTGCSLGAPAVEQEAPVRKGWLTFRKKGSDAANDGNRGTGRRGSQRQYAAATIVLNSKLFSVDTVAGNKTSAAVNGTAVRIGGVV